MHSIKELLDSKNILDEILSMEDDKLFLYFKELSNLNFYLNRHGMSTSHIFTVLDHSKRTLKNFSLAYKCYKHPSLFDKEMTGSTLYKKSFFKRIIQLIISLKLEPHSDDFRLIVLALLLHDLGKSTYDKTDQEIEEEFEESKKKGANYTIDYLKLLYRTKGHEERGAFLAYALLEEIDGISRQFANRLKHLILGHDHISMLQTKANLNFFVFIRRIMDYTTDYNYPIIKEPNPTALLIHELNINYLIYLIDIYSVDDIGKVWFNVSLQKETIYLRAKWFLGKKLNDLISIVHHKFPDIEKNKQDEIDNIFKKLYIQSLRTNSWFLLDNALLDICESKMRKELISVTNSYLNHSKIMLPRYLNQTTPQEKLLHMSLLNKSKDNFSFQLGIEKDTIRITITKQYASKGSLLKLVNCLIETCIYWGRKAKIFSLLAYSGDDERLIDIITIKHIEKKGFSDNMIESFKDNLKKCNSYHFEPGKLNIELNQQELDKRLKSFTIALSYIEIGSRKFQEIKVENRHLSNLLLYSCLIALSYVNIIDVKVELSDDYYTYTFLISLLGQYRITSKSSFKKEVVNNLYNNVLITV